MLIALSELSFTPHLPGKLALPASARTWWTFQTGPDVFSGLTRGQGNLVAQLWGEQSYRPQHCTTCPYLSSVSLCHNFFPFFFLSDPYGNDLFTYWSLPLDSELLEASV